MYKCMWLHYLFQASNYPKAPTAIVMVPHAFAAMHFANFNYKFTALRDVVCLSRRFRAIQLCLSHERLDKMAMLTLTNIIIGILALNFHTACAADNALLSMCTSFKNYLLVVAWAGSENRWCNSYLMRMPLKLCVLLTARTSMNKFTVEYF